MVALSACRLSGAALTKVNASPLRTSAEIATFPKKKLPDTVEDFGKACARLIEATFGGASRNAICEAAAAHTGASPDTFERILGGRTKHPDTRLMFIVLAIYQSKTDKAFPIGGGFEIRITQTGAAE